MRALRIGLGGGRHLPTIGACSGGGRLLTRFTARGPRAEGHLALGNLSSLGQARRKLKNFPTKTMTSQRNKRQLRVINPCQDPGPRGQARGPTGEECKRETFSHWMQSLPTNAQGPRECQKAPLPPGGALGFMLPTREQGPREVVGLEPPPLPPCVLQSGIFLESD